MNEPKKVAVPTAAVKKTYRSPVRSQYGDVRRLTGGGGNTGIDQSGGAAGPTTRMCWIAESLYGVHSPRVALLRGWLGDCYGRREGWALFIVPMYVRFGRRVAAALRAVPALKRVFRPVFDQAVRRACREYAVRAITQRNSS